MVSAGCSAAVLLLFFFTFRDTDKQSHSAIASEAETVGSV
jgi:hypothetical protein